MLSIKEDSSRSNRNTTINENNKRNYSLYHTYINDRRGIMALIAQWLEGMD